MPEAKISSVDWNADTAQLSDGQTVPITNWLYGDRDAEPGELFDRIVAGPDADGNWHAMLLTEEDAQDDPGRPVPFHRSGP